ncbi:HEAT repeat domain-containing protein, partial [Desulfosarcina sp.]|uniref:HEAT repeat domain-containing protein n=1 Tax=Desulfosarcina sp. TaxID=2027861 RepID=UPI003970CAF4
DACLGATAASLVDDDRLIETLEHPRWPVRAAAADALGRRGVQRAAPRLRRPLPAGLDEPGGPPFFTR